MLSRAFVLVVLGLAACSRHAPAAAVEPRDAAAPAVVDAGAFALAAPIVVEPLAGFPVQMDLIDDADAGSKRIGVVAVPLGAREPRPMMIALHGGSDRPEWACNAWRGITNAYPFIVCPRGVGADASLAWSSPADTKARVARAVDVTKKTFGANWVREDDVVVLLVGFSMGATQAAYLAQSDPKKYSRVALAESAYAPEPVTTFARPWAAGGGERAIFLCTTRGCEGTYRNAARNLSGHRVAVRMNIAGTTDHGMWDQVVRSMRRDWPWLVEGVEGWKAYVPPTEDAPLPGKTEIFEAR